jgi:hypothetical protein
LQAAGLLQRFKAKTFIREEEEGDPPHLSLSLSLSLFGMFFNGVVGGFCRHPLL